MTSWATNDWSALTLVLALAAGCAPAAGVPRRPTFGGPEGGALDSALMVAGQGAPPPGSGWSVVEWPEMTEVPIVVGAAVLYHEDAEWDELDVWTVPLSPETPFEARWYAWRWRATPADEVFYEHGVPVVNGAFLLGIPLSDGSFVGRFYGVAYPELTHLLASDAPSGVNGLTARFSTDVFLAEGYTLEQAMIVSQGYATCSPYFAGEHGLFRNSFAIACDPPLDWARPVLVEIPGFVSSAGIPLVAPSMVYTFADEDYDAGNHVYVVPVPSTLTAPAVPASLCAGMACEP